MHLHRERSSVQIPIPEQEQEWKGTPETSTQVFKRSKDCACNIEIWAWWSGKMKLLLLNLVKY